jgi:4,5-dihydroxyphthalate decarboxylase
MTLSIALACVDYEWLEPLVRGEVTADRLDLTVTSEPSSGERHRRMGSGDFDVAEFSLGRYIAGWPDWDFVGIPVFPRRFFPHSRTFVNADAGIESPGDLAGAAVGFVSDLNTLALWARGIYADHYDLDLDDVTWCPATDAESAVGHGQVDPDRIDRENCVRALSEGVIDALIWPRTDRFVPRPANVESLFPDLRAAERDYHGATGFYPVMHNVVVDRGLVEANPWLPGDLMDLFRESYARFAERARFEGKYPLVWWQEYLREERDLFGDVWGRSYELEPNVDELNTMIRYARKLGLTDGDFDARDMFVRIDRDFDAPPLSP